MRGRDLPPSAFARERGHTRSAADRRASALRRPCEAAGVAQRLYGSAARIEQATMVKRATDQLNDGVAVEDGNRSASPLPLFGSTLDQADIRGRESRLDPAASPRVAFDPVTGDEIE